MISLEYSRTLYRLSTYDAAGGDDIILDMVTEVDAFKREDLITDISEGRAYNLMGAVGGGHLGTFDSHAGTFNKTLDDGYRVQHLEAPVNHYTVTGNDGVIYRFSRRFNSVDDSRKTTLS